MKKILVSACLLGLECRYDGKSVPCENVIKLAKDNVLIPVCPEQLGGLSTPRTPSERQRDEKGECFSIGTPNSVVMRDGKDVSLEYQKGAKMALEIAKLNNVDYAILKSKSPSCGKGIIYSGDFDGKLKDGNGVTAELLIKEGFEVLSEKEI